MPPQELNRGPHGSEWRAITNRLHGNILDVHRLKKALSETSNRTLKAHVTLVKQWKFTHESSTSSNKEYPVEPGTVRYGTDLGQLGQQQQQKIRE